MSNSVRPHRQQPTRLPRPWDSPGKNTGVGCHFLLQCRKVKSEREVTQSCPTLRDPMDCSLPGSSVHGIFQARILERFAIPFSRGSSQPKDQNQVSCIAGIFFTIRATREAFSLAAAAAKSLQSCPTLCNPIDGSPPGSPSLGFSRQEHWSGLPFPSPMHKSEK